MSDDIAINDPDLPLSQQDDDAVVAHATKETKRAEASLGRWNQEMREAYDMVSGDGRQWSEEDRASLREQNRPIIEFNRIAPMIDAVAGSQVNNRQETRFLPRSMDDGGAAEILQAALQWVRDNSDAEDEESEAFVDAAICGIGWVEVRVDYTDEPDGKIVLERVDPGEMLWTPSAKKRNLADAPWRARKRKMARAELASLWPEASDKVGYSSLSDSSGKGVVLPQRDRYATGDDELHNEGDTSDDVEVLEYQWCEYEVEVIAADPATGAVARFDAEKWARLIERLEAMGTKPPKHAKRRKKVWYRAFIADNTLLERGPCPIEGESTFRCITCKHDRNANVFYGLVRAVKDPQRWANKWLSQSMHILNTSAKSGVLAEEGAIADVQKFEASWAQAGSVSVVAPGALTSGAVQPKQPPGLSPGLDRLLQFAIGSIPDVSGINRELLGTADRDQAGVLEWQRKQAAQAVLASLFDSFRRYCKEIGRLLIEFVQRYIPEDKIMRLTFPDGNQQVIQRAMLPDAAQYDIVVDQAPTSPNQKMEVWGFLSPIMPALVKMGLPMPVWTELLRYSPLPESAVNKMIEGMQNQPPPPPDPQVMKAEMDAKLSAQEAEMDMQMKREEHALSMQANQQELAFAREKQAMDLYALNRKTEATIIAAEAKARAARQMAATRQQRPN